MSKPHPKPSDRGRDNPEPGPPPATRAEQRDTAEQLENDCSPADGPLAWERGEQEKLPPRGEGSQHNQGDERGPTLRESDRPTEPPTAGGREPGLQSGGNRRPSHTP
jgi:hypothetical protein